MNRIYIVGYMGAGKTTAARRLANRLGWEVYDTDAMLEEKYHISVDDFFHKYDEPLFRRLESQILHETEQYDNAVISTGGGTACFFDNMDWMNQNGKTVFLKISPASAVSRLMVSKKKRPLAKNKTEEELREYVESHYTSRMPFYDKAQYTIKAEDLDIDQLVKLLFPQM